MLINQMDETLLDAAFSMQEMLDTDVIETLSTGSATNSATVSLKQRSLTRLARHGKFSSIETVAIHAGKITPLVMGLNPNRVPAANVPPPRLPLPPDIKTALLRLAAAGNDDTDLVTAADPTGEDIRYAIRFKAEKKERGIAFLVAQECSIINRELADQALRLFAAGLGMLFLAVPLISLFSRTKKKAAEELFSMNVRLQHDVDLQQFREEELKDAIRDLERFNAVSSGRETRIIELKAEVNELLQKLNCETRYNIDKND